MKRMLALMSSAILLLACSENVPNTEDSEINNDDVNSGQIDVGRESKYDFVIENSCGFDRAMINEKVYSFDSDNEAESALKKIMKLTGLPANFEIRAASVDNACAVIKCDNSGNCDRYILYNQEFMEKVKDETASNYSELAILAHEIAHHLSGHTLTSTGSSYDMELESDKFAGFMLYKLGASIDEAKKAFSMLSVNGSSTHPPRSARLAAVSNGYYDAKRNGEKVVSIYSNETDNNSNKSTVTKRKSSSKSKPKENDRWFIYHRICSKNGKFWVTKGQETAYCTGCQEEYYLRWTGGIDIQTGKPYVFDYMETERSRNSRIYNDVFNNY